MYQYADLYMQKKPKGLRYVILNVYGGESLHHPYIVEILRSCHDQYKKYHGRWQLIVTTTTNAVISQKRLDKIIPYVDEFTASYHSENSVKQKNVFKENILQIKKSGKRIKCIIMMHSDSTFFKDSQDMISWCETNDINYLSKQIDHRHKSQFNYDKQQLAWFQSMYDSKSYQTVFDIKTNLSDEKIDLSDTGRACCGGRQTCQDQNYKQRHFFIKNKFADWYCSVNEFFLHVKQLNGEIFVNKDCKMNFSGQVAPIGNLKDADTLLENTSNHLKKNTMPVIQCKKTRCLCGLCAPKAKNFDTFNSIMEKYRSCDIF
jgi:hypothetical protein